MEIKNLAALNAYRYSADSLNKPVRSSERKSASNTDKAEFSSAARAPFADALKYAQKTADSASTARISELKAAVSSGTYNIPAEDVASAILGII
ncbi:MAG: flagellar biosynthesis anti-sigma factor FlgM [Huintestinicola sp.]